MDDIEFHTITKLDIDWARRLHNDPNVLKMLTDPHVVSPTEQRRWFEALKKTKTSNRLIVVRRGASKNNTIEKIGIIRLDSIDHYNKSVCVGLDIHKDFRGQGFAKPIYKKLFKRLFTNGFNRLWLLVAEYNTVALSLYRELGFKEEGVQRGALFRDGCYYDYIMMSILREEYNDTIV